MILAFRTPSFLMLKWPWTKWWLVAVRCSSVLGGFIDKYNVKLPGKQNAAASPGGSCEVLHVEVRLHSVGWLCWCGSPWSRQLPRVPLFPAAWLHPGTHPWGLGVSQWWLEEHTCPLRWGLYKGSFLEAFQHLRDFAVFTDWGHSSVSLRCFQFFFCSSPWYASYVALNPPKRSSVCASRTIWWQCTVACHLWVTVVSEWRSLVFCWNTGFIPTGLPEHCFYLEESCYWACTSCAGHFLEL